MEAPPPTRPEVPKTTVAAAPIYHKQSTKKTFALRVYLILVCLGVFSAMIYNIAIAFHDGLPVLFLAVLNMLLSSIVGLVLVWWYKNDDLPDDKLWYLLILGMLIVFQCITADVFVGHAQTKASSSSPTTASPTIKPPPGNHSTPKTFEPPTHHATKARFFKTPPLQTG